MIPKRISIRWVAIGVVIMAAVLTGARDAAVAAEQTQSPILFNRIAVVPLWAGSHEPDMDEAVDQTLSLTLDEICIPNPAILPPAAARLTQLVEEQLRDRYDGRAVSPALVRDAYAQVVLDHNPATPRSVAQQISAKLKADLVLVGMVWRYRERGAVPGVDDSPASVAFALYLIDGQSGRQLWRGIFDDSQRTVLSNLFRAKERLAMGLRWLSAGELAEFGVKHVFRSFPYNVHPDATDGTRGQSG